VDTLVHHTTRQLQSGLRTAINGTPTPQFRAVEADLRLAGFLTEQTTVTPAGHRYLNSRVRRAAAP
jgi:hypothetical protein